MRVRPQEAKPMNVRVLALDLERTLIDDARSARPRPGLLDFMRFCHERFERVAVFTSVEEADAREVLSELARRSHVPTELLARLEYVRWCGGYKDLGFVPGVVPEAVLLVDDDGGWVGATGPAGPVGADCGLGWRPGQRAGTRAVAPGGVARRCRSRCAVTGPRMVGHEVRGDVTCRWNTRPTPSTGRGSRSTFSRCSSKR
jgi:hypothetical protein